MAALVFAILHDKNTLFTDGQGLSVPANRCRSKMCDSIIYRKTNTYAMNQARA